jgi:hypothetical protein
VGRCGVIAAKSSIDMPGGTFAKSDQLAARQVADVTVTNGGKAVRTFYWHDGQFEALQTAD